MSNTNKVLNLSTSSTTNPFTTEVYRIIWNNEKNSQTPNVVLLCTECEQIETQMVLNNYLEEKFPSDVLANYVETS